MNGWFSPGIIGVLDPAIHWPKDRTVFFELCIKRRSRKSWQLSKERKAEERIKENKKEIIGNTNQYTTDTQAPQVSKMEIRRWIDNLQSIEESDWGDGKLYPGQTSEGTVPEAEGWGP